MKSLGPIRTFSTATLAAWLLSLTPPAMAQLDDTKDDVVSITQGRPSATEGLVKSMIEAQKPSCTTNIMTTEGVTDITVQINPTLWERSWLYMIVNEETKKDWVKTHDSYGILDANKDGNPDFIKRESTRRDLHSWSQLSWKSSGIYMVPGHGAHDLLIPWTEQYKKAKELQDQALDSFTFNSDCLSVNQDMQLLSKIPKSMETDSASSDSGTITLRGKYRFHTPKHILD